MAAVAAKQLEFGVVIDQADHPLILESDFLQNPDRGPVVGRGDGNDSLETQDVLSVGENRCGGFNRVPQGPVSGKKRESHIGVIQSLAFDQTANSDWQRIPQTGGIQAEAVARVAVHRSLEDVVASMRERPDSLVADEADESFFVQQLQNKFGVVEVEFAQVEPRGSDDAGRLNCAHEALRGAETKPNASAKSW